MGLLPSIIPSSKPSYIPSLEPTNQPSFEPSFSPSTKPTDSPVVCEDPDPKAKFWNGKTKPKPNGKEKPRRKTCKWLSNSGIWKINKFCSMTEGFLWAKPAREVCPGTCNSC